MNVELLKDLLSEYAGPVDPFQVCINKVGKDGHVHPHPIQEVLKAAAEYIDALEEKSVFANADDLHQWEALCYARDQQAKTDKRFRRNFAMLHEAQRQMAWLQQRVAELKQMCANVCRAKKAAKCKT